MLATFDLARRELREIKAKFARLAKTDLSSKETAEINFLKSRSRDLLRVIYPDSASTLDHIENVFKGDSMDEIPAIIDHALNVDPPFRRALSSEEDGRTVEALVEAAAWRSKMLRYLGIGCLASVALALALLGFNLFSLFDKVGDVSKIAAEAEKDSRQTLSRLTESLKGVEEQRKIIDLRIVDFTKRLDDPKSDINKLASRFEDELSKLSGLEQDWSRRRETLAAEMEKHQTFLTGKESEVNAKMAAFNRTSADVESSLKHAQELESKLKDSEESVRKNIETIAAAVTAAQADAKTVEGLRQQSEKTIKAISDGGESVASAQRDIDEARKQAQSSAKEAIEIVGGLKSKVDEVLRSATDAQRSFEDHAKLQQTNFDKAVTEASAALTSASQGAASKVTQVAAQTIASLNSSQTEANQHLQTIRTAQEGAVKQSAEITRTSGEVGRLQTEIVTKFENLKTDEQRLKGERDRAKLDLDNVRALINIVEDKRSDIAEKLHVMLDQKPSLDSAAVWKLILASNVLLALCVLVAVLLAILIILSFSLIRGRRRPPTGAAGSA